MNELVKGNCYNDADGNFIGMLMFKPSISSISQNINGKRVNEKWYSLAFVKDENGIVYDSVRVEMGQESEPQFMEVDCPKSNLLNAERNTVLSMYGSKNGSAHRRRSSRRSRKHGGRRNTRRKH